MTRRARRTAVFVLCAALALQLAVLGAWWVPVFGRGRMEIIAHHGDVAHWPEGTLEALVAAAESQADGIEVDVQPSADGTWWAFHDDRLDRLTDHVGSFNELSDADVEQLRVIGGMGSAIAPNQTYRVPRLSEVLAALDGYSGTLILDVRTERTTDYADLAHLVGDRAVILICRTADGAAAVKAINPALDPEWLRRAEAWGARWYLTNHLDAAVQESGAAGSGT